jgi:hypothetical protein
MRYTAPLLNHHADGTLCPADHRHTTTGKPLHADCPGRVYSSARCTCGAWEMTHPFKGYVNECRKRHLASHPRPEGPSALRALLRLT